MILFIPVALGTMLAGADPARVPLIGEATPLAEWNDKFTRTEGWIGADGAYSMPLSDRRTLWFFGDTFVGAVRGGKRAGSAMVNNTVGVQDGTGRAAKLTFPVRRASDKPLSQFVPPEGNGWFWPLAGTVHDGQLLLFLAEIEKADGGGAFGFRHVAPWLGVVENPADEPTAWKATYKKLPFGAFTESRTLAFGSATLAADGFVYVYGIDEKAKAGLGAKRLVVARVPAGRLADFDAWRFLCEGKWVTAAAGLAAPDHPAAALATEFSVSYLAAFQKYVLVSTESGLSDRIVARFADAPEGPWTKPELLYTCPEMKADKKLFTYSAKAHPHLSGDGELVVSYCVNSFDFARIVNDATLYWPKFVRVPLK